MTAERPTAAEVRKARKAELQAWCTSFGLSPEGKVDELRARLLTHLESAAEEEAKPAPAPAPEAEAKAEPEETEGAAEEEEGEAKGKGEAEAFTPKQKPKLDPATRKWLQVRAAIAAKRPEFHRQEWFRHPRLTDAWRKPQGMQSKLRRHRGYRPNPVSIGYRGPKVVRGFHPSGFREVLVHTVRELESVDPGVEAVRIAGTVGTRRRTEIQAAADEKGIRVLNRREEE